MPTVRRFIIIAAAAATLISSAGTASADLRELDRKTAKQDLADTRGVVLVDVYAYW